MAESDHFKTTDYKGIYYKYESKTYRGICKGCGKGYHGNRWDAHHILPGVSFSDVTDSFSLDCLKITPYDINAKYSMGGLPKLTAFILYFQEDPTMPKLDKRLEATITMRRWGTVKQYKSQAKMAVRFPGDYPVHNPCNWGHTYYNKEVVTYLDEEIFEPLQRKAKPPEHPKPENIKTQLLAAKDKFWGALKTFGSGPGGGPHIGIADNLRHRHGTAKTGWWKPLCMSRAVTKPPASPSLQ
jgi:hypothetical protein